MRSLVFAWIFGTLLHILVPVAFAQSPGPVSNSAATSTSKSPSQADTSGLSAQGIRAAPASPSTRLLSTEATIERPLNRDPQDKAIRSEVELEELRNKRAAVELVQSNTKGKILSVRTIKIGKERSYRIKVLSRTGLVHVVQISSTELDSDSSSKSSDHTSTPTSVTKDQ